MKRKLSLFMAVTVLLTIVAASLGLMIVLAGAISGQAPARRDSLALIGGTLYISPTEEPVRNGVVLVNNGTIVAAGTRRQVKIPESAQMVDCSGRTITAGFWNNHVHFMERKWAAAADIPSAELDGQLQDTFTRFGFTAAFDLSSPLENTRVLRDRIESGEARGPRIFSTGLGFVPANPGLPQDAILNFMGWMNVAPRELTDEAPARSTSRQRLASGVDGIKLFISAPSRTVLTGNVIKAVANEAHSLGKPVFAHPNTGADVLAALRAGVDVIAHTTPASGPWDDSILAAVKERPAALVPTLWIWKWYARHDRRSAQDRIVETELGQLRAWIANGGAVLFGTDLGAVDPDPVEEYMLMTQAGMSFPQILASLTTAPAERFGKSKELGRVAAGFRADLVVLKSDPARNIRALIDVQYTIRDGKIVYRSGE